MPLDPINHLVFLCVYLVLYIGMMKHVIHNIISITQYVMESIENSFPFWTIYALMFNHTGVSYSVEPVQC
jgi:hypothetical protein